MSCVSNILVDELKAYYVLNTVQSFNELMANHRLGGIVENMRYHSLHVHCMYTVYRNSRTCRPTKRHPQHTSHKPTHFLGMRLPTTIDVLN